jgi:hypothetical protein
MGYDAAPPTMNAMVMMLVTMLAGDSARAAGRENQAQKSAS